MDLFFYINHIFAVNVDHGIQAAIIKYETVSGHDVGLNLSGLVQYSDIRN